VGGRIAMLASNSKVKRKLFGKVKILENLTALYNKKI